MKEIGAEELKQIQLDMLLTFDKFCKQNNLRYSLGGGTLLGAVRHKGYIPWDDDVDVMMPRPDYDKFVSSFNGFNDELYCSAYEIDKSCVIPFAKIYRKNTEIVLSSLKKRTPIFLDVFPIDGCPSKSETCKRHLKRLTFWYTILFFKTVNERGNTLIEFFCFLLSLILPIRFLQNNIQKLLRKYSYDKSTIRGAISGAYLEKECYDCQVFDKYTRLTFEGYEFMVISKYDEYLTQHYGKYLQLPPKEKQIRTHTEVVYWIN